MISKELIQQLREMEEKATSSMTDLPEATFTRALRNNAVALITAAEECERLREEVEKISKFGIDNFCHQCDRMHVDGSQCY